MEERDARRIESYGVARVTELKTYHSRPPRLMELRLNPDKIMTKPESTEDFTYQVQILSLPETTSTCKKGTAGFAHGRCKALV